MESAVLEGLNPSQREAVATTDGPLLVIAGAGSGKTRVLTHRIAHLIGDLGVSPYSILAITFTNKAADEMKERIGRLVGDVVKGMWVSTFHSACTRILRREAPRLGYKSSFSIYDEADSRRLIGYCVRDLDLDPKRFPPKGIRAQISNAKNELIDYETFAQQGNGLYHEKVADVYRMYQQRLVEASAMDFDDILMVTVELMIAFPEVLQTYQNRFSHILVRDVLYAELGEAERAARHRAHVHGQWRQRRRHRQRVLRFRLSRQPGHRRALRHHQRRAQQLHHRRLTGTGGARHSRPANRAPGVGAAVSSAAPGVQMHANQRRGEVCNS